MIPPWFQRALAECESLSLDVASDRRKLWRAIERHIPEPEIRQAIYTTGTIAVGVMPDCIDRVIDRMAAAVVFAIKES